MITNKISDFNLPLFLSTRKKLLIAVAYIVVGLLLLGLSYQQIAGTLASNSQIKKELQQIEKLNQKFEEIEQIKFSSEFSKIAEVNKVLPSHKPLLELLNNLNAVANNTRVTITQFEISPGEIATDSTQTAEKNAKRVNNKEDYDQLDLDLTVKGKLSSVKLFMDFIERTAPFVTITNLSLDRKAITQGDANVTQAKLSLSTYFYTKPISSAISTPLPDITQDEREIFQKILDFTPAEMQPQKEIISGEKTDLFGITDLSVENLEQQLGE